MNDPDGMVQTIREQEKHIADLELRLKLRRKRILWWQGMASDLYDELIGFYKPESDPFGSLTSTINRFEEAEYEPENDPFGSMTSTINRFEEAERYGLE